MSLPDLEIKWFNLETDAIETITLAGESFEITALEQKTEIDPDLIKRILVAGLFLISALWLFKRFALPKLKLGFANLRDRYHKSSHFAYRQAQSAATHQDMSGFLSSIDQLRARGALVPSARAAELEAAVLSLTSSLYDDHSPKGQDQTQHWNATSRALTRWRTAGWRLHWHKVPDLPPLNPTG